MSTMDTFFLNAIVFALTLWHFFLKSGAFDTYHTRRLSLHKRIYGGYRIASELSDPSRNAVRVRLRSLKNLVSFTIAGRRIPASTVPSRIALHEFSIDAAGDCAWASNSAELLSLQGVYWILSIGSLVLSQYLL